VILRGIRHHADLSVISRALSHGKISIQLSENAKPLLRNLETTSSDQLLLSKIRRSIPFFELQQVSNLPTDHCYRIVYAFHCLGLIHFQDALPQQAETKTRNAETTESQKTPPNAPNFTDEYARKAADEYYQGNFWAAVQNCKKALEFKKDHRIYHLMGKALSKHMGFKYDAMRTYKQALELHPNDSSILKDMADLFLESGNKLMALSTYKRAIAANPRDEHCKAKVKEIEHGNDAGEIILKKLGTLFNGNTKKSPGASGF